MILIRILAYLLLTTLPGAWITFGLPLKGLSFWVRLVIGIILAPVIVAAQFYLLRLAGISFQWSSILLVIVNLPALYLIYKGRGKTPTLNRQAVVAGGLVFLIILLAIAPFLLDPQKRIYTWEAWSQASVVYSFANGELDLQDAELAGMRLSYPWVGQIYQGVASFLLNSPPVSNYIWQNLIWLVCIFFLAGAITAELGGNAFAQVATAVWLSFCVNFVGVTVKPLLPAALIKAHPLLGGIWGDNRYAPWLDKIVFLGQMYFAMGIFTAVLYLVIKYWPQEAKRDYILLIGLLLIGLGFIYPVLLPPTLMVIALRGLLILIQKRKQLNLSATGEVIALGVVALLSLALTVAYSRFLTEARTGASLIYLHDRYTIIARILESFVVTSPLLAGLALAFWGLWQKKREALVILALGSLGSVILYILFDIPWWRNEYKFIFTAAICLAPFLSLALQPVFTRLSRMAVPVLILAMLVLAAPFINHIYLKTYDLYTRKGPVVDVDNFNLRLDNSEPLSGLINAIRKETPQNSLVVVDKASFYYPTLTQRQLYAPPNQDHPYPGILVSSEEMVTQVNGYPSQVLKEREAVLHALYYSPDPTQSLMQVMKFNRPVALVIDDQQNKRFLDWLIKHNQGQVVYKGNGSQLWLIQPIGLTVR